MNSLRIAATELRDNGYSYMMIKQELGVSVSTLSNWFADRPYCANEKAMARVKAGPYLSGKKRHEAKMQSVEETISEALSEVGMLNKRDLMMLGLGIYMGEGSKSIESVRIVILILIL